MAALDLSSRIVWHDPQSTRWYRMTVGLRNEKTTNLAAIIAHAKDDLYRSMPIRGK